MVGCALSCWILYVISKIPSLDFSSISEYIPIVLVFQKKLKNDTHTCTIICTHPTTNSSNCQNNCSLSWRRITRFASSTIICSIFSQPISDKQNVQFGQRDFISGKHKNLNFLVKTFHLPSTTVTIYLQYLHVHVPVANLLDYRFLNSKHNCATPQNMLPLITPFPPRTATYYYYYMYSCSCMGWEASKLAHSLSGLHVRLFVCLFLHLFAICKTFMKKMHRKQLDTHTNLQQPF